jgi:hypothetical protein
MLMKCQMSQVRPEPGKPPVHIEKQQRILVLPFLLCGGNRTQGHHSTCIAVETQLQLLRIINDATTTQRLQLRNKCAPVSHPAATQPAVADGPGIGYLAIPRVWGKSEQPRLLARALLFDV